MNGPFKIGQICLWQNIAAPNAHINGQECEIIGELRPRLIIDPAGTSGMLDCYQVLFGDKFWSARPHQLRAKQPPQEFTGEQRIRELFTPAPAKELEPA